MLKKSLKTSLAFAFGLLVTLVAYASTTQLRDAHPDTYVVVKGDTLWDISARFLNKPWLWPEIWRANPQVENPHLIYPGDVLDLSYAGGPHLSLRPRIRATELGNPIPPVPLDLIKPFLKDLRVVDAEMLKNSPYVMAIEENRLRGVPGEFVYARGLEGSAGELYAVVRPTHSFRAYEADDDSFKTMAHRLDSNAAMVRGPWKEVTRDDGHWGKGDMLGVEIELIGTAEFMQPGDPSTLLLRDSDMEVRAGDRILPIDDMAYDAMFYPHAPASTVEDARVIAFADALNATGRLQVVALSVGASAGVDNGTTFSIFQPGKVVNDDVASSHGRSVFGDHVTLPPLFVGHVMVFRTFDKVSYGLIMDAIRPVHLGDMAKSPE